MNPIRTLSLAAVAGLLVTLAGCGSLHRHADGAGMPAERHAMMAEHMKSMHAGQGMDHNHCTEMMAAPVTPAK